MLARALFEDGKGPSRAREIACKVACLLATGSDPNGNVNLESGGAASMLFVATKCQKPDVKRVFLLLAAGADPHASSRYGWSLAKALTSGKLDAGFHEDLLTFLTTDCDTLLEDYRTVEECPDNEIDVSDIASFFRNLRKEDLLHAAAALCDLESLCQLLYCPSVEFDPDWEIKLNGALVSTELGVLLTRPRQRSLRVQPARCARGSAHPVDGEKVGRWILDACTGSRK